MDLKTHYNILYTDSIRKIRNDDYEIDPLINSSSDNRFGITLLIRPPDDIKNNIQKFLNEFKSIDPKQYYYQNSDIHITVMSIISCYDGFELERINISEYIDVISKSLTKNPKINIDFKGITASTSCIMIQGFMNNESLNIIRNNLRKNFKNSNLQQSIDKRYSIQTAHTTVIRFQEKLKNKSDFLNAIEAYKNYEFGSFEVNELELVYNDWYQKEKLVKKLHEFNI
ncbi:2'-5' RNA ligase family protein [Confluentibacter sediminis]|uniref:2'-5' RNA ligase family protein n=1 Tax=Confluentibacter sediminis TaxID=2219045 RepID=UPI000DACF181|nr:mutarotase [Confluentibacter sediminis]